MGRTNRLATIIIIIFLLFSNFKYSYGDNNFNVDRNIYLIVINKLTLSDIDKMPNLKGIMEEGSFGLMNVRGTSGYRGQKALLP